MSTRSQKLIRYSAPAILSQISFFLFTIFDGIFVGQGVGADALGAINLAFPFIAVVDSFFLLTAIGGVTVTAIRLGRGDLGGANQAFMHSLCATAVIAALLMSAGCLLTEPLCTLMGGNAIYLDLMKEYLSVYSLFLIPSAGASLMNAFARNDGAPILVSGAMVFATLLNIFLDWLFVFPLQMGLTGAALATGISQTVCFLIVLPHFLFRRGQLRFQKVAPAPSLIRKITLRGLPESINMLSTPISMLWINWMLILYVGEVGVNTYSILAIVASFSMAFFFGSAEGLQPLIGQSYGARNRKDMQYYFRGGMLISVIGSLVMIIAFCLFSRPICSLFVSDIATQDFSVYAMPLYAWGFLPMAVNTMMSAYLYSTKRTREALILNSMRSFIANSVIILLLPRLFGAAIVWSTFGIYEAVCMAVGLFLLIRSEHRLVFH